MALPPLASITDLKARVPGDIATGDPEDRADALLADASALVRFAAGQDWVDDVGALSGVPDLASTITLAVAVRAWYNPAGITSQQLGAASVRYGDVWLTKGERELLGNLGGTSGLKSISLTPGFAWERPATLGWAPVDYGGDWAPIGY